jgi:hypothetical protein
MKFIILIALMGINFQSFSQNYVSVAYAYFYSPFLDKCIQTYNFDRPFLVEKQPLFQHGVNGTFQHIFKSDKKFKKGIGFEYQRMTSQVENQNLTNKLSLNSYTIAFILQKEQKIKNAHFDFQFMVDLALLELNNKKNKQKNLINNSIINNFGLGTNISFSSSYKNDFLIKNRLFPYLKTTTSAYYYAPYFEAIINGTKNLILTKNIFNSSIILGLKYQLK